MKATYVAPSIADLGSFEEITQGQSSGSRFDGNFVQGEPVPTPPDIFS